MSFTAPIETILVVDDVPENIDILAASLSPQYRVKFATSGPEALEVCWNDPPSLILLDVMMPGMDGYEVCRRLKADLRSCDIPLIFITALMDARDEERGLTLGAVDYLHKPCHPSIVLRRVRIHLDLHNQNLALEAKVRDRTLQLEDTRLQIIRRLGRAAEYRDNETGMHVLRMSQVSGLLARAAGVPEKSANLLVEAAPMHDIGKIGIPDNILLKPGKLDADEWAIMQRHALIGAEIIGEHDSDLLRLARVVALSHHERWDGNGYPYRLAEEAIPLEGRIVSIADVFDALTSVRPYKKAWPLNEARDYIGDQAGKAFDPHLTKLFLQNLPAVVEINQHFADPPEADSTS
jgi:putative two-component system response regulator